MSENSKIQVNKLLQNLAEALDISESHYKLAEERFQAVGKWLSRDESRVATFYPEIYPQGSFKLGTVIKPVTDTEEYDLDLVCKVELSKTKVSQKILKELVGHEIKGYVRANNMKSPAKESRRCWTLEYADGVQFHMDILPAIPDGNSFRLMLESRGFSNDSADQAIAITDNTLPNYDLIDNDWPRSNPKGYAKWFREQMKVQFQHKRMLMADSVRAKIEDIPEYRIKTPLQQSVQILKRHRDIMFANDQKDKPISIIITTLAAQAYNNEADLLEALINIVNNMHRFILSKSSGAWVPNPVNPLENFAEKWQEYPKREKNFKRWLQQVQTDLNMLFQTDDIRAIGGLVGPHFGEHIINEVLKIFPQINTHKGTELAVNSARLPSRFNVPHKQKPPWPLQNNYSVTVSGSVKLNGNWREFKSNDYPLYKHCNLLFSANTNVPPPFEVFWQVVNTGNEAVRANGLRGTIFPSITGNGGMTQRESTFYKGMHWIECFIVKNGLCVARSGEFVVNIA